jgi:4a-hydroxytetrahydrobiopterin dehydratase
MTNLSQLKCVACRGTEPVLTDSEITGFMPEVPEWQIEQGTGEKHLVRVYKFPNFVEALAFTDQVGAAAEEQDHHPLLITEWGKVGVHWWTHKIHGLHRNDFIMAARTDAIYNRLLAPGA